MLDALRRGAQTWVAKILFGILIISFGVFWGIEDVFRGAARGSLATVGKSEISATDFQQAFQTQLQEISRQAGKRISAEEARAAGFDKMVLQRLVNDAAVSEHGRELKLAISDEALVDNLKNEEGLQGADGKFSRAMLEEVMRQMGVNERGLFAILRKDEIKRQLVTALANSIAVPQSLLDVQHAWSAEARRLEHFTISPDKVTVSEPDEAALKSTYEANKRRFVEPEFRKFAVLLLTVEDLKKNVAVTEEEIKATYERTKETYDVPEKRRVQQIAFKDKAAAEEAKKALDGGKSFRDVAKDAGATEADINLGLVTKKQMIDKVVAEAAFKLNRDEVSPVIEGRFRPVIVRVVEIQPGKESTLTEVSEKIKDALAKERASPELRSLYDQVVDSRNLGKSHQEIAEALKIRLVEIEAADRTNKRPDGSRALEHSDENAIVAAAFSAQAGVEGDPIELKQSNGYAWIDLRGTTPEKEKPFDQVKEDVKKLFTETERKRLIDELAAQLVIRADQGATFEKLASEAGGTVATTEPITRTTTVSTFDDSAVQKAFGLAKGKAASANTADGSSRVVFRVSDILPAPPASQLDRDRLADALREDMTQSQLDTYISTLTKQLGFAINEAELRRATGVSEQ